MTLEHFVLIVQTAQNLEGLRRDMRQNTQSYKDQVAVSLPPQLPALIVQDCDQYDRRLGWVAAIAANQAFLDALTDIGISPASVQATVTELQDASTTLRAGPLDTRVHINAAANALLAAIPAHVRLF